MTEENLKMKFVNNTQFSLVARCQQEFLNITTFLMPCKLEDMVSIIIVNVTRSICLFIHFRGSIQTATIYVCDLTVEN